MIVSVSDTDVGHYMWLKCPVLYLEYVSDPRILFLHIPMSQWLQLALWGFREHSKKCLLNRKRLVELTDLSPKTHLQISVLAVTHLSLLFHSSFSKLHARFVGLKVFSNTVFSITIQSFWPWIYFHEVTSGSPVSHSCATLYYFLIIIIIVRAVPFRQGDEGGIPGFPLLHFMLTMITLWGWVRLWDHDRFKDHLVSFLAIGPGVHSHNALFQLQVWREPKLKQHNKERRRTHFPAIVYYIPHPHPAFPPQSSGWCTWALPFILPNNSVK